MKIYTPRNSRSNKIIADIKLYSYLEKMKKVGNESKVKDLKVQIASDLHLEFLEGKITEKLGEMIKPSAPYLALVGDICNLGDAQVLRDIFVYLSTKYEKILYVPGNHEYYRYSKAPELKDTKEALLRRAREIARETNVIILDNESIVLDGVRVIGSTFWSDIPKIHNSYIEGHIKDYNAIFTETEEGVKVITAHDTTELHKRSVQFLQRELLEAHMNKQKCLVLTHHAPTFKHTSAPQYEGAIGTLAYASDQSHLFGGPLYMWVFGHTHWCCHFSLKNTQIVSNARGYPSEKLHRYKKDKVIVVSQYT